MNPETESQNPLIGIVMGSDSDWPVMKAARDVCDTFKVSCECRVVSAHRTPEVMVTYGKEARERGIKVIIAGAGGAAHLPGMLAACTTLPVIGVPVESKSLKGIDSLLSIVQMPKGVPVATVAINNAANAGLLALSILSVADAAVAEKLDLYRREIHQESMGKTANLK